MGEKRLLFNKIAAKGENLIFWFTYSKKNTKEIFFFCVDISYWICKQTVVHVYTIAIRV